MDLELAGSVCELASSIPHSVASAIWFYIQLLWPTYFITIVLFIIGWLFFEIKTRNGTWHYNSKNGFSRPFNAFVGVVVFSLSEGLIYGLFNLITWGGAHCIPWLGGLYLLPFGLTAWFLVDVVGFWVEKRPANSGYKRKGYRWRKKY